MTQPPEVPSPPPATLNDNQARRIASTFAYVDSLLREVDRLARDQISSFSREQRDLSDVESRLLLSVVDAVRSRMLATLDHLGLPRPAVNLSARWSITTNLRFIDIALSELTPKTLRGYGEIDGDSAAEVGGVAAELRELVSRGREALRPHEGEQLRERLASIPDPLGEVLRAAEELSTRFGIVEVRPLIAAAAERALTTTIEIGIFGRVSSGKSSLINALVGAPLLPVGATPVTAVPLRVVHGPDGVTVYFANARQESIEPERLPEFATEWGNHDNMRGVHSILIRTPRLADGLALLDTPGVGSLSLSGPAQAFAWLPRCDLGIVLVAAGTPLGRDEIALVSGLTHAGIPVEMLLSKTDLIPEDERAAAIAYVQRDVARATNDANIRVRAVSTMQSDLDLLDEWRETRLVPMVAERQRVTDASRARRVRAILAALNAGIRGQSGIERSAVDRHRARLDAERSITAAADELESSLRRAVAQAADAVVTAWEEKADGRAAARQALLDPPNRALARARAAADGVLEGARLSDGDGSANRIPPLFDPPWLDALPVASAPGMLDHLFAHARASQQLDSIAKLIDDAYGTYANRIRAWGLERLNESFARVQSTQHLESAHVSPELRHISALIEEHFPAPER